MKIETYLNAYAIANRQAYAPLMFSEKRRVRQLNAFRDRIIRHDERQKMRIAQLEGQLELEQAEVKRLEERMGVYRT